VQRLIRTPPALGDVDSHRRADVSHDRPDGARHRTPQPIAGGDQDRACSDGK
jgi:hypothetical protein